MLRASLVPIFASCATAALLGAVGTANAQAAPGLTRAAPDGRTPKIVTERYGWQIVVTDLSVLVVGGAVAASSDSDTGALLAVGGYLLGGPTIHLLHKRPGRALGSLGMRAGLPVLGAILGASLADCGGPDEEFLCGVGEAALGMTVGGLVAVSLDAGLLARDERVDGTGPALSVGRLRADPDVHVGDRSVSLGLRGTF